MITTSEEDTAVKRQRKKEATRSSARLGFPSTCVHFLDYPDGRIGDSLALERRLITFANEILVSQTVYFTHIPDNHQDHCTVHSAVKRSFPKGPILGFPIVNSLIKESFFPTVFVDIAGTREAKRLALSEHSSQIKRGRIKWKEIEMLERSNGTRIGVDFAEGFQVFSEPSESEWLSALGFTESSEKGAR